MTGPRQYAPQIRDALRAAVAANGQGVLEDPVALGGLLADLLPDAPQVIQVLLAGVRIGTVSDLIAHAAQGMDAVTAIRLTATTMRESTLIDQDACLRVSTEFAIALAYPGAPDSPPAGAPRETLAASISAATERPAGATAPLSGREAAAAPAVTAPVQSSEAGSPPVRSRPGSRIRPGIALRRQRRWVLAAAALLVVAAAAAATVIALRPAPSAPFRCPGSEPCAIKVGQGPDALLITPDGKTLYVANGTGNSVTPVAGRPQRQIPVINAPDALAVTQDGKTLYVATWNGHRGTVIPISTTTRVPGTPIVVGRDPVALAVAPDGTLYVADSGGNTVTVVPPHG